MLLIKEFIKNRDSLKESFKAFLTLYSEEEYLSIIKAGGKIWLSPDKKSGFIVKPDGELISVFSLVPGRGDWIVKEAIKMGATHLDCIGEKLRALYERHGFKVVKELEWNDAYAPLNWDYKKFGRPKVYLMRKF